MVTMRVRLLQWTLSEEEIPFSDITVDLESRVFSATPDTLGGTNYSIELKAHGKTFEIYEEEFTSSKERSERILAAICRLGIRTERPRI